MWLMWVFAGNPSPEFSGCKWFEKKESCEGSHLWEEEFYSFLEYELFDFLKTFLLTVHVGTLFLVLFIVEGFLLKPFPPKNSSCAITVKLLSCFTIFFPNMPLIEYQLVI